MTISGYQNEEVIVNGNDTEGVRGALIELHGNHITLKNMTIARSGGSGVSSSGASNTIDTVFSHHNMGAGIVLTGDYNTAQNCRIWYNARSNEGYILSGSWSFGISCARYPSYCTIKNTTSWENWGEGISTFESFYTTIEDNVAYNNLQNFYISDTQYTVFQRNLSYCTPENALYRRWSNNKVVTQNGLLVGDEKGVPVGGVRQPSSDNQFLNNMIMGCSRGIAAAPYNNNLFAYNTIVNANGDNEPAAFLFYSGSCTNCRFVNNLVLQEDSRKAAQIEGTGMVFENNLWSKVPEGVGGSNNYVSSSINLARTGTLAPGQLTSAWFHLLGGSYAINRAKLLPEVTTDFYGNQRGSSPDIGAYEYAVPVAPTATLLPPTVTVAPEPGNGN